MILTKRMAFKESGIMHTHPLRIIAVLHYEKLIIIITEFICAFSKFQLQEQIQLSFQTVSRYIIGGNDSDEEREDYRHLDPTPLKRMKKSLMLQCYISRERNRLLLSFHCLFRAVLFSQWDCRADWLRCSEH